MSEPPFSSELAQAKPELEPSDANFSILSSVPAVLKSLVSDSFVLLKIIKKPKTFYLSGSHLWMFTVSTVQTEIFKNIYS